MSKASPQSATAYLNGEYVPFHEMKIPVYDGGFMQGVTVAEQMRTFNGKLFRVESHLTRLERSLEIVGVDPGLPISKLGDIAEELVGKNHPLLADGDDLGVTMFITPGPYVSYIRPGDRSGPTIGIHTQPVAFGGFAYKYTTGERLAVCQTRQVSPQNWPAELKCRSRMHYFLADKEAREIDAKSRALLLDLDGNVSEASTANVFAYRADRGFISPPQTSILPGISLAMLQHLAAELKIPFHNEPMKPTDFANADEVLLCSTSPCVLPVVALDNKPIGNGEPGPIFERLLAAWGRQVGLDIAEQAGRFANR